MRLHAHMTAVLFPVALASCGGKPGGDASPAQTAAAFQAERAAWVKQREDQLRRPDGWTALIGLHWLADGPQSIGGGDGNDIRLSIAPAVLGKVELRDGNVYFTAAPGASLTADGHPLQGAVRLVPDGPGAGTVLGYDDGNGRITLIERGQHLALRVHHADAPTHAAFKGLDFWPADPQWRLQAHYQAHPAGRTLPVLNKIGDTNDTANPGWVQFDKDGQHWTLEAFGDPAKGLHLIFRDATSGQQSYGVGRYLNTGPVAADGNVVVDFNRAYNPPCAYTEFATCPLPPRQNDLARQGGAAGRAAGLAITAGEKRYAGAP